MNESMQDKRYMCTQTVIAVQFGGLGVSETGGIRDCIGNILMSAWSWCKPAGKDLEFR